MVRYRPGVTDAQFEAAVAGAVPGDARHRLGHVHVGRSTRSVRRRACSRTVCSCSRSSPRWSGSCCCRRCWRATRNEARTSATLLRVFGASAHGRIADACVPIVPVAVVGALLGGARRVDRVALDADRHGAAGRGRARTRLRRDGAHRRRRRPGRWSSSRPSAAAAVWVGRAAHRRRESTRSRSTRRVVVGGVTTTTAASMVTAGRAGPPRDPVALGGRRDRAGDGRSDRRRASSRDRSPGSRPSPRARATAGTRWSRASVRTTRSREAGAAAAVRRLAVRSRRRARSPASGSTTCPASTVTRCRASPSSSSTGDSGFVDRERSRAGGARRSRARRQDDAARRGRRSATRSTSTASRCGWSARRCFPITNGETFALADGALFTHDGVEALEARRDRRRRATAARGVVAARCRPNGGASSDCARFNNGELAGGADPARRDRAAPRARPSAVGAGRVPDRDRVARGRSPDRALGAAPGARLRGAAHARLHARARSIASWRGRRRCSRSRERVIGAPLGILLGRVRVDAYRRRVRHSRPTPRGRGSRWRSRWSATVRARERDRVAGPARARRDSDRSCEMLRTE